MPHRFLGDSSLRTCRTYTKGRNIGRSPGRNVVIVNLNYRMVKGVRCRNCCIKNNTIRNFPLTTIRRNICKFNITLTFRTRNISCRATSVKAKNIGTACLFHDFNRFRPVSASGTAGIVTIRNHNNNLIICCYTNKRARIATTVQISRTSHCRTWCVLSTVLHNKLESTDSFYWLTMGSYGFIPIRSISTAQSSSILKDSKPRIFRGCRSCFPKTNSTLAIMYARRLAVTSIISISINTGNYSIISNIVCLIFRIGMKIIQCSGLVCHFLHSRNYTLRFIITDMYAGIGIT